MYYIFLNPNLKLLCFIFLDFFFKSLNICSCIKGNFNIIFNELSIYLGGFWSFFYVFMHIINFYINIIDIILYIIDMNHLLSKFLNVSQYILFYSSIYKFLNMSYFIVVFLYMYLNLINLSIHFCIINKIFSIL